LVAALRDGLLFQVPVRRVLLSRPVRERNPQKVAPGVAQVERIERLVTLTR
jgi:hypothetical protein